MHYYRRMISLVLAFLLLLLPSLTLCESEGVTAQVNTKVTHFLLLGQDTYSEEVQPDSRTDSIFLLTLDDQYERIILTSIMRDSKVKNPKGNDTKINNVYKFYGLEGITSTVEKHLDVEITGSVLINYENIKKLIDALGGVDIEIDINECIQISKILLGKDPNLPKEPGMTHMTGRIALAYMRDRSSGSGDFSRTQRQRNVVNELVRKCRNMDLAQLSKVYNSVIDGVETDLNALQMLMAFQKGYSLLVGATFVENNVPASHTYSYGVVGNSSVLNVKWAKNATMLHDLLNNPSEEE